MVIKINERLDQVRGRGGERKTGWRRRNSRRAERGEPERSTPSAILRKNLGRKVPSIWFLQQESYNFFLLTGVGGTG